MLAPALQSQQPPPYYKQRARHNSSFTSVYHLSTSQKTHPIHPALHRRRMEQGPFWTWTRRLTSAQNHQRPFHSDEGFEGNSLASEGTGESQGTFRKAPQGSFFLQSTAPTGCPCPLASYLLPQTVGRLLPPSLPGEIPVPIWTVPYQTIHKCHICKYMASQYIKWPCTQPSHAQQGLAMVLNAQPRRQTTALDNRRYVSLETLSHQVFQLSLRSYKILCITAFRKTLPSSKIHMHSFQLTLNGVAPFLTFSSLLWIII